MVLSEKENIPSGRYGSQGIVPSAPNRSTLKISVSQAESPQLAILGLFGRLY